MTLDRATVLNALRVEDVVNDSAPLTKKRWAKCRDPSHERRPLMTPRGTPTTYCETCRRARRKIRYAAVQYLGPNLRKIWMSLLNAKNFSRSIRRVRCSISFEQFMQIRANPCFYCSGELPRTGCGLDRIEPTGSYDIDNVVPACTRCNHARGAFITFDEFSLIMRMRRERMGPDADLWAEHPPRGLLITVRRSR